MKSFFKEFLRDASAGAGAAPQICLGVFGKHPAWDDHMDDLGLETESLVAAKRLIYRQGIGGQLDSGAWEKLDEAARLPAIHHEFVWTREAQVLAGRMWPSTDGKRRALYPMVACAHGFGISAEAALTRVLPQLESVEAQCGATRLATKVREIIAEARERCGEAASGGPAEQLPGLNFELGEDFVRGPLAEILRDVRSHMAAYQRGRFRERAEPPAVGVRVPAVAEAAVHDLVFWNRFFAAIIDPEAPLLLSKPLRQPWLDVIAGEPASQEFFSLRAAPPSVPILGESGGPADESAQQEALSLWAAINDPESARAREGLVPERTWLKKIFG